MLQVSEIAKQQGDHSVSGDLLERALFSFGRSVHSTFPNALSEGKARLDFRRPENREFWLASWRYINNLGQRGTWRTTYEWAKLLLSLDPEGDPYSIRLLLDQLALRGGQAEHFLSLCKRASPHWIVMWNLSPNVLASTALAEYKLKRPEAARSSLRNAITNFPWLFARLFQVLNIGHIPKAIWGKIARNDREEFESEIYVTRAKDLWNTPEAISFLVEVAESLDDARGGPLRDSPIKLNEARHVLVSDVPSLISLLPRHFTTMPTSAADPLPPLNNEPSYSTYEPEQEPWQRAPPTAAEEIVQDVQEYRGLQAFFARIIPWLAGRGGQADRPQEQHTPEDIVAALQRSGEPLNVVRRRSARMLELQDRLMQYEIDEVDPESAPHEPDALLTTAQAELMAQHLGTHQADAADDNDNDPSAVRTPTSEPSDAGPAPDASAPALAADPDERDQRWLAGTGLLRLRDFVAENGVDEGNWAASVDDGVVREYARRMLGLRKRAMRGFLMDYVLQQGTSTQVKELVERAMEGESRGGMG